MHRREKSREGSGGAYAHARVRERGESVEEEKKRRKEDGKERLSSPIRAHSRGERRRRRGEVTNRDHEVVNFTRSRVKNNFKLTNLMKISRIEGYNGKYGSNPQGIREIYDDLFKFDQIE